jgi:hypothetical protein
MIRDPNIFRSGNAPIHKHGHDVAPEAPSTLNVRFGSKADTQCPLVRQPNELETTSFGLIASF